MLRWELDVRSNVFYTTQAEETTMYPSMRRTTRDNLELHYAQYTWLSSLCAFSAKGILHFITSVISISKPSSGKKRHFIIYLLEGMLFFRFGIFHFLFYSRTVCVWEREGMCDAQHKEISPWPLLSIWSFVYWLIPSEIFLWGFDVRRRIFESKHWAARNLEYHRKLSPNLVNRNLEISKLVRHCSRTRTRISINVFWFRIFHATDGLSILPLAALLTGTMLTIGIAVLLIVVLAIRKRRDTVSRNICDDKDKHLGE